MGDHRHNRHGPKRWGGCYGCCARFAQSWDPSNTMWPEVYFRTKWRLNPSSRLATINMGQKLGGGGCALCSGDSWVPIWYNVAWTKAHLHVKCHLHSSSRLATIKMGRKLGGGLSPLFGRGELVSHLAQCGLDQGPPPCQVPS